MLGMVQTKCSESMTEHERQAPPAKALPPASVLYWKEGAIWHHSGGSDIALEEPI